MKFKVSKNNIANDLDMLASICPNKPVSPALAYVRIEAMLQGISLATSNGDLSYQADCVAEVEETGICLVRADKLAAIIKNLPLGDIAFSFNPEEAVETEGGQRWMKITSGGQNFRLPTIPPDGFPAMPECPVEIAATIPARTLLRLLALTVYASTSEDQRYTMDGVNLTIGKQQIEVAAADGHRLSVAGAELEGFEREAVALIPRKAVAELQKLAGRTEKPVVFISTSNHLFFRSEGRLLISRMVSSTFPNYSGMIPKDNEARVFTVPVEKLKAAARGASLMADKEISRGAHFRFKNGSIEIESRTIELGETKQLILVAEDEQEDETVLRLDIWYICEYLNASEAESVNIELRPPIEVEDENAEGGKRIQQRPVVLKSKDGMCSTVYVTMPMRLDAPAPPKAVAKEEKPVKKSTAKSRAKTGK